MAQHEADDSGTRASSRGDPCKLVAEVRSNFVLPSSLLITVDENKIEPGAAGMQPETQLRRSVGHTENTSVPGTDVFSIRASQYGGWPSSCGGRVKQTRF